MDFSNRSQDLSPEYRQTNVQEGAGPKPNCMIALLKTISSGRYDCGYADALPMQNAMVGNPIVPLQKLALNISIYRCSRDRSEKRDTAMTQHWRIFLARSAPPGAILGFSAAEFALQVAINLRYCLNLVRPTPECIALADLVLLRARNYGEARMGHKPQLFAEAEDALAKATRLLEIELEYCAKQNIKGSCEQAA
ncbi:hypothetical protein [Rhizobium sp.]|uniref:hypothetical protein n=1 Tax=Rhizobium sp. TaxID=391 RepID=UPI0034C650E5